jgi:hypothetical protein
MAAVRLRRSARAPEPFEGTPRDLCKIAILAGHTAVIRKKSLSLFELILCADIKGKSSRMRIK